MSGGGGPWGLRAIGRAAQRAGLTSLVRDSRGSTSGAGCAGVGGKRKGAGGGAAVHHPCTRFAGSCWIPRLTPFGDQSSMCRTVTATEPGHLGNDPINSPSAINQGRTNLQVQIVTLWNVEIRRRNGNRQDLPTCGVPPEESESLPFDQRCLRVRRTMTTAGRASVSFSKLNH